MPEVRDDAQRAGSEPDAPDAAVPAAADAAATQIPAAPAAAPALDATQAPAAAPSDTGWLRVSPKYIVVEVIGSLIGMVIFVGALVVAYLLWGQWWALWGAIALGVILIVSIAFEPRRVRSIGYRLREDDLLFRRGIMFQRQVAVPYGRMQLVDITRGPVARALGLADLKFVTAAASTAVTVPGLPMEEADRLRDELVALAETRRAGL
jgi:uncharacterized protein